MPESLVDMLPILIPYIIFEIGLRIVAVLNILKAKREGVQLRFDPTIWIVIVAFINFGWLLYFIIGRAEE